MHTLLKSVTGTAAVGAMALAGASPAVARDRHDDGIGAGEIIAGALIIGGIAAIAASSGKDRYDRYDRYDRRGYDRDRGSARSAVERCVRAAEREAYREGFRRADVTDIRDVDRKRRGYEVKGRIAVDTGYRGGRYGRGWGNDYRGYRDSHRGYDSGRFTCRIERGRVVDMDFKGIRGLR